MTAVQFAIFVLLLGNIGGIFSTFPLLEYLNMTDVRDKSFINKYTCSGFGTCCNCKDNCMQTKTCCIDKLWNGTLSLKEYIRYFKEVSKSYNKELTCGKVLPNSSYKMDEFMMVQSCVPQTNNDDVEACLNYNTSTSYDVILPVFGSDKYLYRSAACARCNFIKQFQTVSLFLGCDRGPSVSTDTHRLPTTTTMTTPHPKNNFLQSYSECTLKIVETFSMKDSLIHCYEVRGLLSNQCPVSNPYHEMCNAYSGRVNQYRNYDCYRCNHMDDIRDKLRIQMTCSAGNGIVQPKRYTWSITINFSKTTSVDIAYNNDPPYSEKIDSVCSEGESYNIIADKCEKINCPPNHTPQGVYCVKNLAHIVMPTLKNFDNCFLNKSNGLFVFSHNISQFNIFKRHLQNITNTDDERFQLLKHNGTAIYKRLEHFNYNLSKRIISNKDKLLPLVTSFLLTSVSEQLVTEMYGFDVSRNFGGNLCAEPITYEASEVNFTDNCEYLVENNTLTYVYAAWMKFEAEEIKRQLSLCIRPHLYAPCERNNLSGSYIVDANYTIQISNKVFSYNQYVPLGKGIAVCITPATDSWRNALKDVEYYISIVLTSISILAYIFIIATFIYFKELHSVPSYNTIALCMSLFLTDIFYLVLTQTNGIEDVCTYLAVVMHFLLLVSHLWVVMIAIDLASKFKSFGFTLYVHRRFLLYCFIAITVPLVIVSIAVGLDQQGVAHVGYGEEGMCWIAGNDARIISYILPVCLVFIIAMLVLSFTIVNIRNGVKNSLKTLGKRKSIDLLTICLKIALVLGITEFFGFIQVPYSSESAQSSNAVFAFLYTLSRSLRGILLFFVYIVFNKKIVVLYKAVLKKKFDYGKTDSSAIELRSTKDTNVQDTSI